MSDAVTTPVAPAPTTTTETAGAPAPAPTVTEGPKTAEDFLAQVSARAMGGADVATSPVAPTVGTDSLVADAQGNLHGPDGKFVAKPAGDEPAASAQDPAPASEGGATTTEAAPAAPAVVRLALPEGHPLRDRGIAELPFDVPTEHEELARSLINEPVRKREIAEARQMARAKELEAAEARAEAEFWRQNAGQVFTPEFFQKYQDIKQTYGDADAELYKQAIIAKAQGQVDQRRSEVVNELAAREVLTTAQQFRAAAVLDAQTQFPGWTQGEIDQALQAYGAWVHATGQTTPRAEDWYRIARPLYESSSAGQQRKAQEAQRIAAEAEQKAKAEAAERERQALEAAAAQRQRNPLQGVPNIQTGLTVPGASGGPTTAQEFLEQTYRRARGFV